MKISKFIYLVKLGLSKKFLRKILYIRKLALGVGLIRLSTIILILAIKLYLRHKRFKDRLSKIIKINEENSQLQYEFKEYPIIMSIKYKSNTRNWSDNIGEML